jgi:hypothetical protein
MERIFGVIKKINSVVLLLVLVGIVTTVVWVWRSATDWERRGEIPVAAGGARSEKILLQIGEIENIKGANVQMLTLTSRPVERGFVSKGYDDEIRNVIFLSGKEMTVRWMFPTHRNLVLRTVQLKLGDDAKTADKAPAKALYIEYITQDTNKDGRLSMADAGHIALLKPDGTGFVEVLGKVTRILSYDMTDDEQLSIVYQADKSIRHARFSIETFKKVHEQAVLDLPEQL